MNGAPPVQKGSDVGIPIEPAAFLGDVVGHDQVQIFLAQLLFCVGNQRLRLGGKTYKYLPVFFHAELTQNIRVGFQVKPQSPLSFLDLLSDELLRVIICYRGSH